jgi:DNA-binding NarL/FixJ family response regulator
MRAKGRARYAAGEAHYYARHADEDIRRLFVLSRAGWRNKEIASYLGMAPNTVSTILHGKRRKTA